MLKLATAAVLGLIFGIGIAISGMIDPSKVINFFDVFGTWDPSLALVMGGGLAVSLIGYRLVLAQGKPLLADAFSLPKARDIDRPLVLGSGLFGIGWGLSGFCPGGAIPALGIGRVEPFLFVGGMILGMAIARVLRARGGSGETATAG